MDGVANGFGSYAAKNISGGHLNTLLLTPSALHGRAKSCIKDFYYFICCKDAKFAKKCVRVRCEVKNPKNVRDESSRKERIHTECVSPNMFANVGSFFLR